MFAFIHNASVTKLIGILLIVGFLTYLSSFTNQFVWDDDHFFYQNIFTQSLTHLKEIFTSNTIAGAGVTSNYYRPFTTMTFALDHQLWGWNPVGLHLTNTLFHCLNGALLLLLLILLGFGKLKSFLISIIFIIHPIQTEAVTYLSSRGDILYLFFLLLSLYLFTFTLYHKHIRLVFQKKTLTISHNLLLLISLLLFPLSILSKEGALTTVPIYAGILFIFALPKRLSIQKLHKTYPNHFAIILLLFWIALVYFGLRLTVLDFGNSLNYSGDQSEYARNISTRLFTFLKTLVIYIRLLLIPYPLYLERTTTIVTSFFSPWVLGSSSIIVLTLGMGWYEFQKKYTGWIFFALLIIFANLASVSGIIPMTGLLRENWLYMPMIGFYMILFVLCEMFFRKIIKKHTKLLSVVFILYCFMLIGMTIQQNYSWRNSIAYFEHTLQFVNTARLHLNLGNAYIGRGEFVLAEAQLKQAEQIDDSYPQTHYNLANIYIHQKKYALAEKELRYSLLLDPDYLYAYPILINVYEKTHQFDKALPYLKRLTKIYPNDLKITLPYANDLWQSKNTKEADIQFAKAIVLSHHDPKLIKVINDIKKNTY